ncbi:hypothetical protein ACFW5K_19995 [Streptomyces albidoflavus]
MKTYSTVADIPARNARDLAAYAEKHGWKWVAAEGQDSDSNSFVTVIAGNPADGEQYKVTWHTRETGTFRLFSKLHQRAFGTAWLDAPSLTVIRRRISSCAQL